MFLTVVYQISPDGGGFGGEAGERGGGGQRPALIPSRIASLCFAGIATEGLVK